MILLSDRLNAIASLVPNSKTVADIGCDHAYIAIHLIQSGKAQRVIGCDVNKGPLMRALENAKSYDVDDKIELRLSDGLEKLNSGEADSIVIAGMGGPLMQRIVIDGLDRIHDDTQLILQPQSDIGAFRRFLKEYGFNITQEAIVYEDGKYYPMMRASRGIMNFDEDIHFEYGKLLLESANEVLRRYLLYERGLLENILEGFTDGEMSERSLSRKQEIKDKLLLNEKAERYINEMQ